MTSASKQESSLMLIALCAAGITAFIALAGVVLEQPHLPLDEKLLLALRQPLDLSDPIGPPWLEEAARDVTALGSITVLTWVSLMAAGHLALRRKWRSMLFLVVSVGGGVLLNNVLKAGFDRPRPDLVPHITSVYTASFPSGHAMLSAVVYLSIGVLLMRLESRRALRLYIMSIAVFLTFMVGASRVYLGVHWPSDVLAGWVAGASWALFCWIAAGFLQRRGKMEGQSPTRP